MKQFYHLLSLSQHAQLCLFFVKPIPSLPCMHYSPLFVLALSLLRLCQAVAPASWINHPGIRSWRHGLIANTLLVPVTQSTGPTDYLIYHGLPNPIKSIGFSFDQIYAQATSDLYLNMSIFDSTNAFMTIRLGVNGNTLMHTYVITWIAVDVSVDFVEVYYGCHMCAVLNAGAGDRSEGTTVQTHLPIAKKLRTYAFLSTFFLRNRQDSFMYVSVEAALRTGGSNVIDVKFSTKQSNVVSQICYTILTYSEAMPRESTYDYVIAGYTRFSKTDAMILPELPFPATNVPTYNLWHTMFFGVSYFNISTSHMRDFYFNWLNLPQMIVKPLTTAVYSGSAGTYDVKMSYFWLTRRACPPIPPPPPVTVPPTPPTPPSNQIYFNPTDMQCYDDCTILTPALFNEGTPHFLCAGCHAYCLGNTSCIGPLINQCTACNPYYFRTLVGGRCVCTGQYIDIGEYKCQKCNENIPGCRTCVSLYTCTNCQAGFVLSSSGLCQCTVGALVSGVCTTVVGCTKIIGFGNTYLCTECNETINFEFANNFTCICKKGSYMTQNKQCLGRCGDGVRTKAEQQCDDGNGVDGDGCTAGCRVEEGYVCEENGDLMSECMYAGKFEFKVRYVRRSIDSNTALIGLEVSPYHQLLLLNNFRRGLTHNLPSSGTVVSYADGLLLLQVNYTETIENRVFLLQLTLDPSLFYQTTIKLPLIAKGMNARLSFDQLNHYNHGLQVAVWVLDALALLVGLASCASERMIGIETVQTLQIVLFSMSALKSTPASLSALQQLQYSNGYNQLQGIDYGRVYPLSFSLSALGLEKQFLLSYNLMFALLLLVIAVCLGLKSKLICLQSELKTNLSNTETLKKSQTHDLLYKIYLIAFQRVLFFLTFVSQHTIIFALLLQMLNMTSTYSLTLQQLNTFGALLALCILCTLTCSIVLGGIFPNTLLFPMLMKAAYPPGYFVFQSALGITIACLYSHQFVLYIVVGLCVVFGVGVMVYQPYPRKMHNYLVVFNLIYVMGVAGVFIFENWTQRQQHESLTSILSMVIVGVGYMVVGLGGFRVYKYYTFLRDNGWNQYAIVDAEQMGNRQARINQLADYQQLKTARANYTTRKKEQGVPSQLQRRTPKASANKRNKKQREPPSENMAATKQQGVTDYDQTHWNYNRIVPEYEHNGRKDIAKLQANQYRPKNIISIRDKQLNPSHEQIPMSPVQQSAIPEAREQDLEEKDKDNEDALDSIRKQMHNSYRKSMQQKSLYP